MDDSFSFGKPARRQVGGRRKAPRAPRSVGSAGRSGTGRVAGLVVVGVVAVLAIAGYMAYLKDSGEQIASDERTAVSQIDTAKDVEAKMTAQQAAGAVQQLYAEQGSFQGITPAALKSFEPASSYTGGASTGPRVVSVSASSAGVGLAVRSESGTCFLERFSATDVTYATGGTCTGQAAMSANGPSWSA